MLKKILAAWAVWFCLSNTGFAQEENDRLLESEDLLTMPFEELMNVRVITPTRNLQQTNQAPATVVVVTKDQIKLRGYRTLAEVLNDLPDFAVYDKSDPQFYNPISLRGVYRQDLFLIMLDGIRISSPTNEPLPILENFPIYLARQIEVVYGPGSALYGADAMAGVINIITYQGEGHQKSSIQAAGGSHGYTSANLLINKELPNDFYLSVAGQYTYDYQPDFSKVYKDEYVMTSHETGIFNSLYGPMTAQVPVTPEYEAPVKSYNIFSSIEKDGFSMKVLHHYVQVPSSTTLKPDNGVYNREVFYGQGITTGSASYSTAIGKLNSISTLVGSLYKVNPESNYRNLYGNMTPGFKYSTGSMMKAEQQIDMTLLKKVNLIAGFTYELFQSVPKTPELQEPVDTKNALAGTLLNSASTGNPGGIDVKFFSLLYRNIGAYVQGQYTPANNISITTGMRYDHNSRFGSTVNPRIGAVYHPFNNTTVKVLYGTAFWAPSPHVSFESYGSFYTSDGGNTYRSGFWHLPNPDLKPMTSQMAELSLGQKIKKDIELTLTLYRSEIKNTITNVHDKEHTNLYNNRFLGWDVDYIEIPFNQGSQQNYGGSLAARGIFSIGMVNLNAWSSLSYVEGKVKLTDSSDEVEQATLTPLQFRIGIDGKVKGFHFSARLLRTGKQRTTSFSDDADEYERHTIKGYSLLNLSTGYTWKKSVTLFINVQNALDQCYRNPLAWDTSNGETFSSSFQNPLRIMTGLSVKF
ncbi:receptor, putative [Fulvivirga imtechensis AK7]|uniref:Receptor, putative n=1 Tax=Fulvivirga imtechensis AK7 TaxID=1237149 RepID=L8JHN8_9BACT|nr:TonB-dependent receptor [Fulvivirga imtechensis]ELR68371.1 receptor, putative [Fulvivirga imtechensis AK7]